MDHDLTAEQIIPLREACGLFPPTPDGKPAHLSRLYRYTTHGCRGVRLAWLQCGATRCTTREAIRRFFNQLTEVSGGPRVYAAINKDAAVESGKRLAGIGKQDTRRPTAKPEPNHE